MRLPVGASRIRVPRGRLFVSIVEQLRAVLEDHRVGVLRENGFGWGKGTILLLFIFLIYLILSSRSK